jgi:hypothetical protein
MSHNICVCVCVERDVYMYSVQTLYNLNLKHMFWYCYKTRTNVCITGYYMYTVYSRVSIIRDSIFYEIGLYPWLIHVGEKYIALL